MSAGICIAKSSTPIRTLFELHSICLKVQKGIQGKTTVLKEQWMFSLFAAMSVSIAGIRKQFVPAANSELSAYLDIIRRLKNDVNIKTAHYTNSVMHGAY